jgi:aminopeptidase N
MYKKMDLGGAPWWKLAAIISLCAGFVAPGAPKLQAQAEGPKFDVQSYIIDAELFPLTHTLSAKVQIALTPRSDLLALNFQLHAELRVDKVLDDKGNSLSFRQDGLTLQIDSPNPLTAGKPLTLALSYSGTLATSDGSPIENLKLAYVGGEGSYLLYQGCWFPVREDGLNRFAATMHITVPSDEVVIASGKPDAPVRQPGKVTYGFHFDQASFPGTVVAGRYSVVPATAPGADITFFMKPGHEGFVGTYGEAAARMVGFYSDKFGPLPDPHLSVVEIDDGSVTGYSTPGVVALASRAFANPVNQRLLAHEISHQWWRCLVSPAMKNDAFLDEGLATYSAALYLEAAEGETAFEQTMHDIAVGALTHESVASVSMAGSLHEYTPEYQSIVYQKGAMVFHMLRWVIGDDAFFKTLKSVVQQYAGKTISTDEFQKVAEQASGQQLTYFFAQWVSSTGVPQFKRTWSVYRVGNHYQVLGKITQDLDIFRMPVEIRVYVESRKPVNQRIEMVGTTADFTVNTVTRPTKVVVDPGSRILKYDEDMKYQVDMSRADQLVQQQAYLEAIKAYQDILKDRPTSSLAHYRQGEVLFKLHNFTAAMEEFRQALQGDLDPKWIEVWSHLMLGEIFDVTGQRDRALNEYQRALQTNDNTQGALDLANQYIQKPFTQQVKMVQ